MRSSYLNLKNTHFLFGDMTSVGLDILETSLKLWDRDTGYPSSLIKHNMRSTEPYTKKGCIAGIVSETGKGSYFSLTPLVENTTPVFQFSLAVPEGSPARTFEAPMRLALKGSFDITQGYTVYLHTLTVKNGERYCYYGVTSRHWMKRLREHEADSLSGSPFLFHRALREKIKDVSWFCSTLLAAGKTKDEAYGMEEYLISKYSLYPMHGNGLNMIPGGYEGIRWLGKMGEKVNRDTEPEDRDIASMRIVEQHPKLGNPNPAVAMRWEDDSYAEAVICGRENRLSVENVRLIRMMAAEGYTKQSILKTIEGSGLTQISRVLAGLTYSRIK